MRAFPVQAIGAAGMYVYNPDEWEAKGVSGSELADKDLKAVLEGLAKHLFGDVEVCPYPHLPQFGSFYPKFFVTCGEGEEHAIKNSQSVAVATFQSRHVCPF